MKGSQSSFREPPEAPTQKYTLDSNPGPYAYFKFQGRGMFPTVLDLSFSFIYFFSSRWSAPQHLKPSLLLLGFVMSQTLSVGNRPGLQASVLYLTLCYKPRLLRNIWKFFDSLFLENVISLTTFSWHLLYCCALMVLSYLCTVYC